MKLATSNQARPTTQSGRIYALEQARQADGEIRKAHGERLEKIEQKLDDIYGLLVNARLFKRVMDGFFKYSGQLAIACGAGYGAWKFFTGH